MITESDIRKLFLIKDDAEYKEKVIGILHNLVMRIHELEGDVASLVLKDCS